VARRRKPEPDRGGRPVAAAAVRVVTRESASDLAARALAAAGLRPEEAASVADVLVEAELAGHATHGLIRVAPLCEFLRKTRRGRMRVLREAAAWALIDAAGEIGYLAAPRAVDLACEKASAAGVAVVGVRNTTHAGFMGVYAARASARGMIGAVCADTFPLVAPTGATEALLGTNPLAVAFPSPEGDVVVDLSTAAVTVGELLVLESAHTLVPPGLAYDSEGRPTADPAAARRGAVVPFGGPKGYCLALVLQLLSGALTGAGLFPARGEGYGILAAALAPGLFTSREEFAQEMKLLRTRLKALRRERPGVEVLLPGERARLERESRLMSGIEVRAEILDGISAIAGEAIR
jgi:delta1-piperideine-2-carboxylate reductase